MILNGVSGEIQNPKPDQDHVVKIFKALDRIGYEKGFLQYYINLISKIMRRAVFCKPAEIPEILVDQFRAKNNEVMMDN